MWQSGKTKLSKEASLLTQQLVKFEGLPGDCGHTLEFCWRSFITCHFDSSWGGCQFKMSGKHQQSANENALRDASLVQTSNLFGGADWTLLWSLEKKHNNPKGPPEERIAIHHRDGQTYVYIIHTELQKTAIQTSGSWLAVFGRSHGNSVSNVKLKMNTWVLDLLW